MWNAKCDETDCEFSADTPYQADLILPVSAHRIETGHLPMTVTGEDEIPEAPEPVLVEE